MKNLEKILSKNSEMIHLTKWDKVLVVSMIFASLTGMYFVSILTSNSDHVYLVIEVNGEEYKKISLDDATPHQLIDVQTEYGINKIEISGTQVRMKEADCRDQLCVKAGWLLHANQTSVCLPNKISIKLMSNHSDLDIISY